MLSAVRMASGGSSEGEVEEECESVAEVDRCCWMVRSMRCWTVSAVIGALLDDVEMSSGVSKKERSFSGAKVPCSSWKISVKMV